MTSAFNRSGSYFVELVFELVELTVKNILKKRTVIERYAWHLNIAKGQSNLVRDYIDDWIINSNEKMFRIQSIMMG